MSFSHYYFDKDDTDKSTKQKVAEIKRDITSSPATLLSVDKQRQLVDKSVEAIKLLQSILPKNTFTEDLKLYPKTTTRDYPHIRSPFRLDNDAAKKDWETIKSLEMKLRVALHSELDLLKKETEKQYRSEHKDFNQEAFNDYFRNHHENRVLFFSIDAKEDKNDEAALSFQCIFDITDYEKFHLYFIPLSNALAELALQHHIDKDDEIFELIRQHEEEEYTLSKEDLLKIEKYYESKCKEISSSEFGRKQDLVSLVLKRLQLFWAEQQTLSSNKTQDPGPRAGGPYRHR